MSEPTTKPQTATKTQSPSKPQTTNDAHATKKAQPKPKPQTKRKPSSLKLAQQPGAPATQEHEPGSFLQRAREAYARLHPVDTDMSPGRETAPEHQSINVSEVEQGDGAQRRQLLIQILVEHHLAGNPYKLKIKNVAEQAGISRQALDRYYSDLKPYMQGKRNLADLVSDDEEKVQIQVRTAVNELQARHKQEIDLLNARHEHALQKALDSHITSLMNNDLVMFDSTQIRTSLEKQSLYNAELRKQNQAMNIKLALAAEGIAPNQGMQVPKQTKLIFDLDIEALCTAYHRTRSIQAFEEAKNDQLRTIRDKLNGYADSANVHVVLFADRYISLFKTFADRYMSAHEETCLIVRLPLFSRNEVKYFTDALPRRFKVSMHVPFSPSESEKKAHRVFRHQKLAPPAEELRGADKADTPNTTWGFEELTFFRVQQGD